MMIKRPNWVAYIGRDWSHWDSDRRWMAYVAWGHQPNAAENEIPWDHLWRVHGGLPSLIRYRLRFANRDWTLPIGIIAFGRTIMLWNPRR